MAIEQLLANASRQINLGQAAAASAQSGLGLAQSFRQTDAQLLAEHQSNVATNSAAFEQALRAGKAFGVAEQQKIDNQIRQDNAAAALANAGLAQRAQAQRFELAQQERQDERQNAQAQAEILSGGSVTDFDISSGDRSSTVDFNIDTSPVKGSFNVTADQLTPHLGDGLKGLAQDFVDAGAKYGLDPRFLASISKLETANGTSSAFRNRNNAMGISNSKGPTSQTSHRDSIFAQARSLAKPNGYYKNAKTISEIGNIYAPPGAGNNPNNTNGSWAQHVGKFYQEMVGASGEAEGLPSGTRGINTTLLGGEMPPEEQQRQAEMQAQAQGDYAAETVAEPLQRPDIGPEEAAPPRPPGQSPDDKIYDPEYIRSLPEGDRRPFHTAALKRDVDNAEGIIKAEQAFDAAVMDLTVAEDRLDDFKKQIGDVPLGQLGPEQRQQLSDQGRQLKDQVTAARRARATAMSDQTRLKQERASIEHNLEAATPKFKEMTSGQQTRYENLLSARGNIRNLKRRFNALSLENITAKATPEQEDASLFGEITEGLFNKAVDKLKDLAGVQDKDGVGGSGASRDHDIIQGVLRKFAGKIIPDDEAAVFQAELNAMLASIGRGLLGEKGVLTDKDITRIRTSMPNITNGRELGNIILGTLDATANRQAQSFLGSVGPSSSIDTASLKQSMLDEGFNLEEIYADDLLKKDAEAALKAQDSSEREQASQPAAERDTPKDLTEKRANFKKGLVDGKVYSVRGKDAVWRASAGRFVPVK
jgi:hypothetical protein